MNRAKISGKTDPEIPARRCPPTALQNSQKSANPDLQNPKNDNSESEKKNIEHSSHGPKSSLLTTFWHARRRSRTQECEGQKHGSVGQGKAKNRDHKLATTLTAQTSTDCHTDGHESRHVTPAMPGGSSKFPHSTLEHERPRGIRGAWATLWDWGSHQSRVIPRFTQTRLEAMWHRSAPNLTESHDVQIGNIFYFTFTL
jgi:hypothetical protein